MKILNRLSIVYLAIFGAVFFMRACMLTHIDPAEVGVRYNNASGLLQEDLGPGWHMEIAGLQRVWVLPSHYLFINYSGNNTLSIRTQDNNTVNVDVSIPYRIKPNEAWQVMDAGNHLTDTNGKFRFQRFAEETTTSVLRERIAQLTSEEFYNTERRLEVAADTLKSLNAKLVQYHLECDTILLRAAYFRQEYENQLARIQFNEQQKLLDGAQKAVADKQQTLDSYNQQTNAQVASQEQDWAQKLAQIDRGYQVGFVDVRGDNSPGSARRALNSLNEKSKLAMREEAAKVLEITLEEVTDAHLLGIKNIDAETAEYSGRVLAEADGISARLAAEGHAKVAKVKGAYEARVNRLLDSPAGRAYVAYHAAANINFSENLTFHSGDGIPSVLRLGDFAREFMGR